MPIIAPFQGLRYNSRKVRSLAKVLTPPYDVISLQEQAAYYRSNPFNFIRILYGKQYPSDTEDKNRYSRARRTFEEWIRSGVLVQDSSPSVYPYLQEYQLSGQRHQRWGVIVLVRLDSPRIYPHEQTKGEPKKDRLRLLEAVGASLSPLFGLIPDEKNHYQKFIQEACRSKKPIVSVRISGVLHRLWKISDSHWIKKLGQTLHPKELIIADGHHRFESAIAYRNARQAKNSGFSAASSYNLSMFYLSAASAEEPGLLPTHRLISRVPPKQCALFLEGLKTHAHLESVSSTRILSNRLRVLRRRGAIGIGLYAGTKKGLLLTPKKRFAHPLDVEWLHQELLPEWIQAGAHISYTQDLSWGLKQLKQKQAQAVFVLQPPSLKEVLSRARNSIRMPGKTTYFYPKPLSGFVEYLFNKNGGR